MRKIVILFLLIFLAQPCFSLPVQTTSDLAEDTKTFHCEISFDWISKTQLQRDENIKEIQNILFSNTTVTKYKKKEFQQMYSENWKNKNYLKDYDEISSGKTEDDEKKYCGFYYGKLLVVYGIQYKNAPKHKYYYDAMGGLRWVDVFSENYPKFPYWSYQYYRNGKLTAAYYNLSDYDQYIFDANKKFIGRAYKEKIYDKNAKVIMTRTNFWEK